MTGTLYGLGIGPGDPELITLKAHRLLQACPVIAYPAPDRGDSLARAIVDPHVPAGRTEIVIRMPMVSARFPAREVYDQAAAELGGHLAAGRDVAVICEGDPFFYGSFMYLFERMVADFPVEVVPGVSSLMACSATLGAPLAARSTRARSGEASVVTWGAYSGSPRWSVAEGPAFGRVLRAPPAPDPPGTCHNRRFSDVRRSRDPA